MLDAPFADTRTIPRERSPGMKIRCGYEISYDSSSPAR